MNRYTLIDTDILIDVSQQNVKTIRRLEKVSRKSYLGISFITEMELIACCRDKKDLRALATFFKHFKIIHLNETISELASSLLMKYHLSHGLQLPDCLIAATALYHGIPILTKSETNLNCIEKLVVLP